MTPALFKDTLREIRCSLSRFLSIFAIIALGVGFFAGVRVTGKDMRLTADDYFTRNKLADVRVVSTLGLSEGDLDALRELPGVAGVAPGKYVDAVAQSQDNLLVRLFSLPSLSQDHPDRLNLPRLLEGRLPQKADECLLDANLTTGLGGAFSLGERISFLAGKPDEPLSDSLSRVEYTIVGLMESPLYIDRTQRGSTNIGSGTLNGYVYLPEENFTADYYSEVYLSYQPARQYAAYTDAYDGSVDLLEEALEHVEAVRAPLRLEEIRAEAQEKLDDAQAELDDARLEMEERLSEAEETIRDAQRKLDEGQADYEQGLRDFEEEIGKAQAELDDAREQIRMGWDELEAGRSELHRARQELNAAAERLASLSQSYAAAKPQMQQLLGAVEAIAFPAGVAYIPAGEIEGLGALRAGLDAAFLDEKGQPLGFGALLTETVDTGAEMIEAVTPASRDAAAAAVRIYMQSTEQELAGGEAALAAGEMEIAAGEEQIRRGVHRLNSAEQEYQEGLAEFEKQKAEAQKKLDDAQQQIAQGRSELADGKQEYEEQKADAQQKIDEAQRKLDDAQKELNELEPAEWYIQDRRSFSNSYAGFGDDSERIDNVAAVFPVFFLAVAALVCLTTMTRMVEERRGQIGIARALGYGSGAIASQYLIYVVLASLLGGIFGLAVGFKVLPTVIYDAYCIMYDMPPVIAPFHWGAGLVSCAAAVLCAAGVTLAAAGGELSAQPAEIMRPKAPKAGKRVLLERIPFLWRRFSFSQKVTFRNIFRYKKRVFMTVTGIAGCTALTLTGFGLSDAIDDIVRNQYTDICLYDLMAVYEEEVSAEEVSAIRNALEKNPDVSTWSGIRMQAMDVGAARTEKILSARVMMIEDPAEMGSYFNLRTRIGHQAVSFDDTGAVVTEKLATLLKISIGDEITLTDPDGHTVKARVSGITENYAAHYVYMTPAVYREAFGEEAVCNALLVNLFDREASEGRISEELLALDGMVTVSLTSAVEEEFGGVSKNLGYVVMVLIVSAGALAFVVLYNLSNINITERTREIATLKVLGFFDGEVSSYIGRENILLTLLGDGLGLLLGVALTRYVVLTAEIDSIMFGRTIYPRSFLIAALLTLVFSSAVSLAMHFRLKKIGMVESMKSVD